MDFVGRETGKRLLRFATSPWWSKFAQIDVRGTKTCTAKLPVEILEHVEGLGSPGQIRKVQPGYARNYLIPNKLARIQRGKQSGSVHPLVAAVTERRTGLETERLGVEDDIAMREKAKVDQATRKRKLESVVKKLTQSTVMLKGKVRDADGLLLEAVGPPDIVAGVAKQLQIEIVEELLDMKGESLVSPGDYLIPLKLLLFDGSRAALQVKVVAKSS